MTKRPTTRITELEGIRYVQGIVQNCNSIFQSIDQVNDQGNDCYIEFVLNNVAMNHSVFVQIKSGKSYKDKKGYKIPADQGHLKYWSNALYLSIGIVYDPEINKAYWVDITTYLKAKPEILTQNDHIIRIDSNNEFSENTFSSFIEYCMNYRYSFTEFENFGRSLDYFSNIDKPDISYEGLKALYSNHRNKEATWFYIITNFSKVREDGIRKNILGLLSNYANIPKPFWPFPDSESFMLMQKQISKILTKYFRKEEIMLSLPYMKNGINIGSFSYLVYSVLDLIDDVHILLKNISFNEQMEMEDRNFCFWLYMHYSKYKSIDETLNVASQYLEKFPNGNDDEALIGLRDCIQDGEILHVG